MTQILPSLRARTIAAGVGVIVSAGLVTWYVQTRPAPAPVSCSATYVITYQSAGTFDAKVTITNTGRETVHGWTAEWTFSDDQRLRSLVGGAEQVNGQTVTVSDGAASRSNRRKQIEAGRSVTLELTGTWHTGNRPPAQIRLNGFACALRTGTS